jgi:hypothetical protein
MLGGLLSPSPSCSDTLSDSSWIRSLWEWERARKARSCFTSLLMRLLRLGGAADGRLMNPILRPLSSNEAEPHERHEHRSEQRDTAGSEHAKPTPPP